MRNILITIFLLLSIIVISSCSKNNDYERHSFEGEWTTVERHIKIDHEFLDQSFKNLFAIDDKEYIIKRIFTQVGENQGALETKAINRTTGDQDRYRSATYTVVKDSLYIQDSEFSETVSVYRLDSRTLITQTKLRKKDLDNIYREIGGDPNLIPDDTEATLIMREVK